MHACWVQEDLPEGKGYYSHSGMQLIYLSHSLFWQLQTCYRYVPRSVVQKYVSLCTTCQLKKPRSVKAPLKPIITNGFLSRLQVCPGQTLRACMCTSFIITCIDFYRLTSLTCGICQMGYSSGSFIVLTTGQSSTFFTHWNASQLSVLLSL